MFIWYMATSPTSTAKAKQDADLNNKARLDAISRDLLCGRPDLSNKMKKEGWNILHCAVAKGDEDMVTQILAVAPELIQKESACHLDAPELAIGEGHEQIALRLVKAAGIGRKTWFHSAAAKGCATVVAHLLAQNPSFIRATVNRKKTALHLAAFGGHSKVVECLLAADPRSANAVLDGGSTALHGAVFNNHIAVVAQLLAVSPALINAISNDGVTVLHRAPGIDLPKSLLAIKPELISMKDHRGNTFLHFVAATCQSKEFIEEMWRLYPEALRAANTFHRTPFHAAVEERNDAAIELFQQTLTWEEIANAYADCKASSVCKKRFRPVMETQCESLSTWLVPGAVDTVFEYLGFERVKRKQR